MPCFVAIEGIEGAGKSTLRSKLAELAPREELEIIVTREPGATAVGRSIRALLLDPENSEIDPLTELMLFSADRVQHLKEVIRPALERKALVICDRFIHSTLAYQGYGRELPMEQLHQLNQLVTSGLKPDLVLLLDLPPEEGLDRAKHRRVRSSGIFMLPAGKEVDESELAWNRFEEQELAFHTRVREGFLTLAKDPANNFVVLDARKDPEAVAEEASSVIRKLIEQRQHGG